MTAIATIAARISGQPSPCRCVVTRASTSPAVQPM
jgi:hypothetical protein